MSKILLCFSALFVLSISTYAQSKENYVNHYTKAFAINSQYVKSFIGLNLDSLKRLPEGSFRIEVNEAPIDSSFIFNGIPYKTFINIVCDQYQPELISLMDIKEIYAKEISEEQCLFMINDVLLTNDLKSFRIDKNYIHTINIIYSRELERIDGGFLKANLITIYTKTDYFMNMEKNLWLH